MSERPLALEQKGLSDQDWLSLALLLPSEAPQARAMSNRDFVDAVSPLCVAAVGVAPHVRSQHRIRSPSVRALVEPGGL